MTEAPDEPSGPSSPWRALRRSLLARVLGVHALGLVVAAALTLGSINLLLQLRARAVEHQVLREQAASIIGGLSLDGNGEPQVDYGATPLSRNGHNTFTFTVRDATGRPRLSSGDAPVDRLMRLALPPRQHFAVLHHGDVLSTITRPFVLDGQRFWISVAWNLSAPGVIFDDILSGFLGYSAATTLVLLAALLGIDLLVMRTSLRPLLRVVQAVRQSHRSGDDYRLSLHELPREILPMARAYNEALDKAEGAYQAQREFTADAAHELRTPLAVLQARIETLERGGLRRQLLSDVAVMGRIVGQLLQIASLERLVTEPGEAADPVAVCTGVVEALAPVAVAAERELGLTLPDEAPAPLLQIRDDELFQVVRNLVENAIHHTRPGTRIDVAVGADGVVVVSDDGPGIPAELHAKVFERFWRRERQTRSGAGLGLAIVRRLVQVHGGTIGLESAPGRGCRFRVRLPTVHPEQGPTEPARSDRSVRARSERVDGGSG